EPAGSRDDSEVRLRAFGARVQTAERRVTLTPGPLRGAVGQVPGDISSAAFLLVAAAIVADARVTVTRVGVNPTRTGLLDVLAAMGATLDRAAVTGDGEPSASLTVATSALRGTTIGGALV